MIVLVISIFVNQTIRIIFRILIILVSFTSEQF